MANQEQVEFEFPEPEETKEDLEIEVEGVAGRENVLETKVSPESESVPPPQPESEATTEPEAEIEIVDDTPPEDRNRVPSDPPEELTEDELNSYSSEKVKNRIKHFSKGYHDERRAKEEALRERTELENWAKKLQEENHQLKGTVDKSQATLLEQAKKTVTAEVEHAKRQYKDAYEAGDPDQVVAAQDALTTAKIRMEKVNAVRAAPLQNSETAVQVPQSNKPSLDSRTEGWRKNNVWFGGTSGEDTEMTAFALGVHQKLEKEGITAQSNPDAYYERIDSRMRQVFPNKFGGTEEKQLAEPKPKRTTNVVAPATRSVAPKKIILSETQQRVAKRLGVPLELYAQKVAEEMRKQNG